ncbi:MAG: DUF3455 domain-containing protein [Terriglobales bacterium]
MDLRVTAIVGLLCLLTFAMAQESTMPEVPDKIKAPAGGELVLAAHATGFQIYSCQLNTDGQPAWLLKAPEAELRDNTDRVVGRHYAGPTWKHSDGSEVTGKVLTKVDSPDADAIPWLLLTATNHSGRGTLAGVSTIQGIHTKGGQPPAAARCTSSNLDATSKSSYVADYYFYAPAK